ncbi:PP2C family protein-serine/threonine phosphatase [Thauera sp.]|uniref:PP2C family protein-serine/threonine phosphatase n=1 Tax=Thauera sp. TaxID=1905334 RepID=UPI0039E6FC5B
MRFTIYQESRTGRRSANQDRIAYCYSRDALLMLVADGMGGHQHGELAAHIAAQYVTQAFQRDAHPALADPLHFLSRALSGAHHAILDDSFDRNLAEAPRTTIVACVVQYGTAWWAHAGDSRLYLLRRDRILEQTRDHSRVQLLLEQGVITADEAASHPGRNRIYSCLGGTHAPQIEYSEPFTLKDGDLIALCSDGLWGPLDNDTIVLGLNGAPPAEAVPQLLDRAEFHGGDKADNLSLVAMCWHDDIGAAQPDAISTQTMSLDDFATEMELSSRGSGRLADLDEDEIERAIREINAAIHKFDKR